MGVVFILLSVLLLRLNETATSEYMMCKINIIIGVIMFAAGLIYLVYKKATADKEK